MQRDEKRRERETKRSIKREGKRKVRRELKRQLDRTPDEAPFARIDYGRASTRDLNAPPKDKKRARRETRARDEEE